MQFPYCLKVAVNNVAIGQQIYFQVCENPFPDIELIESIVSGVQMSHKPLTAPVPVKIHHAVEFFRF
ncbi:hypothetical protein SDC9_50251 [bioreactor metagenome]|uniref:Uncharacterized protein n=1 Tax=bioreactor metagenome TaxID=1076179 RepID=A0A644WNY8_9ZZZZ